MLSIYVVEVHLIFDGVIVRLLNKMEDMKVMGVANTAESALQKLMTKEFDLVLVDVSLPKMNGINLVNLIYNQYPNLPCLMLSGHAHTHYVNRAIAVGARGYILKDNSSGIIEGIRHVVNGEIDVCPELRER